MDQDPPSRQKSRYLPLDYLRGLLILLMALDHANYHIAQQHSTGEYWGGQFPVYASPVHFLTRFVTHLSAPGFFFLMGTGMVLFVASRRSRGWRVSKTRWHFLIRGSVLILLQLLLSLVSAWGASVPFFYVGVLAALGMGMILSIPLLDLKPVYLAVIALFLFVILEILTPAPGLWGQNFDNLLGTLLVYSGGQNDFWVNYPLLAWLEVIVLGMIFGKWLLRDTRKTYQRISWAGLVFLVGFLALRLMNGFGNIRPYQGESWMAFLSLIKYPPSMTYVLFTLGVNFLLLGIFSGIKNENSKIWQPLLVFGRVPLFSYLVHLGIYIVIGRMLTPAGSSLGVMYLFWLAGLILMYFPARWYGEYKTRQPASSWVRFF